MLEDAVNELKTLAGQEGLENDRGWSPQTGLPAGDALHLVCAEQAGAKSIATPDAALGRNAQCLKIKPVVFS